MNGINPTSFPIRLLHGLMFGLLAYGSMELAKVTSNVTFVWFANIYLVLILIRSQPRQWWFTTSVALLCNLGVNMLHGHGLWFSAGTSIANLIEVVVGATLVNHLVSWNKDPLPVEEVIKFFLLYLSIAAPVGAVLGSTCVYLNTGTRWISVFENWWLGDVVGMLVLAIPGLLYSGSKLREVARPTVLIRLFIMVTSISGIAVGFSYITVFPFIFIATLLAIVAVFDTVFVVAVTATASILLTGSLLMLLKQYSPTLLETGTTKQLWIAMAAAALLPSLLALLLQQLRERRLRQEESEARFEDMFNLVGTGLTLSDAEGQLLRANRYMLDLLKYDSEAELIGKTTSELTHPDDLEMALRHKYELIEERADQLLYNMRFVTSEGETVWAEVKSTRMKYKNATYLIGQVSDISEQREKAEEISALNQRLGMAADAIGMGIWDWNLSTNELYWDDQMYRLYAIDPERGSMTYEMWRHRLHPDDIGPTEALLAEALAGKTEFRTQFRVVLPTGDILYIQAAATRITNETGNTDHMVGMNWDITPLKRTELELSHAKELAEQASQSKSEFLANMSHEIRTPLNAIIGLSQLLTQSILTREQENYLAMIHSSGKSLLNIINDILDLSKIEANKLEITNVSIQLDELMANIGNLMSVNIGDKDVELIVDVEPQLPLRLSGDSVRLEQILINLTGNAVKFTEHGEIIVKVRLLDQSENIANVCFSVSDTGIGMSPQQLGLLFTPFRQADSSATRKYGGTGLGLTISKRLIEMMGGQISVSSQLGEGSQFTFALPLGVSESNHRNNNDRSLEGHKTILVVDDNPRLRDYLGSLLNAWNCRVDLVESGQRALEMIPRRARADQYYEEILVDWKMPGMNGLETIKALQNLPECKDANIYLMVSAFDRPTVEKMIPLGQVKDILLKPVTASTLFNCLLAESQRELKPTPGTTQAPDFSDKTILLVEDNELNRVVAQGLLTATRANIECAFDGKQAVDRLQADPTRYDLVLMDVQMPVMDGFTATRLIREELQLSIPVIAMTAGVLASERNLCFESGMTDFIGKPVDSQELLSLLRKYLSAPEADSAENTISKSPLQTNVAQPDDGTPEPVEQSASHKAGPAPAQKQDHERPKIFDPSQLTQLMQLGPTQKSQIIALVKDFILRWPQELVAAEQAFNQGANEDAARTLHTLRGSSGTLGAKRLVETALVAEKSMPQVTAETTLANFTKVREDLEALIQAAQDWLADVEEDSKAELETNTLNPVKYQLLINYLQEQNIAGCTLYQELRAPLSSILSTSDLDRLDQLIDRLEFAKAVEIITQEVCIR